MLNTFNRGVKSYSNKNSYQVVNQKTLFKVHIAVEAAGSVDRVVRSELAADCGEAGQVRVADSDRVR